MSLHLLNEHLVNVRGERLAFGPLRFNLTESLSTSFKSPSEVDIPGGH